MSLDTGLELVSNHLIKLIKSEVAWRLYGLGYTQLGISKLLGVTQPMVNRIISSHDEMRRRAVDNGLDLAEIDSMAGVVTSLVLDGKVQEALEYLTNKLLINLSHMDYCDFHRKVNDRIPFNCRACELMLSPRDIVVRNLVMAVNEIESNEAFASLIPRVLMNIAESIPNPKSEMDVAAIPGRIGVERGRPKAWGIPAYGVSTHLGRIILDVSRSKPRIRAVTSIKYNGDVENAIKAAGLKYSVLSHAAAPSEDEIMKSVAKEVVSSDVDAVADLGGFGIEPITYVFGTDSLDVVHKLRNILAKLMPPGNRAVQETDPKVN